MQQVDRAAGVVVGKGRGGTSATILAQDHAHAHAHLGHDHGRGLALDLDLARARIQGHRPTRALDPGQVPGHLVAGILPKAQAPGLPPLDDGALFALITTNDYR